MKYDWVEGRRFGSLTVVTHAGQIDKMICKCDCGSEKIARLSHLKSGSVKSCGCLLISRPKEVHGTHLARDTPEYKAWNNLVYRCTNPKSRAYEEYGGRGITVCDEWLGENGFQTFLADMGMRPSGGSIDRIDNSKGYSKQNCRWATMQLQSRNRRSNKLLTVIGQTKTLQEWSEFSGVKDTTINERLNRGWPESDAVFKPTRQLRRAPSC